MPLFMELTVSVPTLYWIWLSLEDVPLKLLQKNSNPDRLREIFPPMLEKSPLLTLTDSVTPLEITLLPSSALSSRRPCLDMLLSSVDRITSPKVAKSYMPFLKTMTELVSPIAVRFGTPTWLKLWNWRTSSSKVR